MDATFLSTKVAGGFVECIYAMYATSLGKENSNKAYFDFLEYIWGKIKSIQINSKRIKCPL